MPMLISTMAMFMTCEMDFFSRQFWRHRQHQDLEAVVLISMGTNDRLLGDLESLGIVMGHDRPGTAIGGHGHPPQWREHDLMAMVGKGQPRLMS